MRPALVVAVVVAVVAATPAHAEPAPSGSRVSYRPPVDAPIADPWRPPASPYGAGNRGVDYATSPGDPVSAAADGIVTFAGQVAGDLHVVVLHGDGVRTTYAFLRSIAVQRGQLVSQGDRVGRAGTALHFGARIADAYVDPTLLLGDGLPEVHLVPEHERSPGSEKEERAGLVEQLRTWAIQADTAVSEWSEGFLEERVGELRGLSHYAEQLVLRAPPVGTALGQARAAYQWWRQRDDCTPASAPPPRLPERRLAVLVGGLGSSSEAGGAAIDDLDTGSLGYAPEDVARFSYRGGTTADNPYRPPDTTNDLRSSARLLRRLLQDTSVAHPGIPIDVLAHSQGGIVAREALTNEFDGLDPTLPQVKSLVTFGSPHDGSDLATAAAMWGSRLSGGLAERGLGAVMPWDPAGTSVGQMSEASSFMRDLNSRPLPAGLWATSIGGRHDYVVASGRTHLDHARNVVVDPPGFVDDHGRLPGSRQALREAALAVNGRPPTCQSLADSMGDASLSDQISLAEDAVGAAGWFGALRADRALKPWSMAGRSKGDR